MATDSAWLCRWCAAGNGAGGGIISGQGRGQETFSGRARGKHELSSAGDFPTAREAAGGHWRRPIAISRASHTIKVSLYAGAGDMRRPGGRTVQICRTAIHFLSVGRHK
jgi:hypothetical protein